MHLVGFVISLVIIPIIYGQHGSPPGVNPQHYQNANYQTGQQYQQHPQQGQQYGSAPGVPPNQQNTGQIPTQPNQYQNPPQQQYHPPTSQQQYQAQPQERNAQQPRQIKKDQHPRVLHKTNIKEETAHIKEHLDVPLDTSGMSENELQFHYFKLHDVDNNNKLDGQELIKSLFHWHDSANHDATKSSHPPPENKVFSDEDLINMIDPILQQDDSNKDGFVDYPEFVRAQSNAGAGVPTQGEQ